MSFAAQRGGVRTFVFPVSTAPAPKAVVPAPLERGDGYVLTADGLRVTRDLNLVEWLTLGERLRALGHGTMWAIGDWLAYGHGRGEYGRTYTEAFRLTGMSYENLGIHMRVSRAYQIEQRVAGASWTMHREALRLLPDQRLAALQLAVQNGWGRDPLGRYIDQHNAQLAAAIEEAPTSVPPAARRKFNRWRPNGAPKHTILCPNCGHRIETRRS